jgi:large subunit ribosomal protein L25
MEELNLEVHVREELKKSKTADLRGLGFIPAVMYSSGKKTQHLKITRRDFTTLLHGRRAENIVINLKLAGSKEKKGHSVIIKEIQYNPVTDAILHIDFNEISLTTAIKVKVPVAAKGEPLVIKTEGGSLDYMCWELEVECLPTQIPEKIEVDVVNLKIGQSVHVRDLVLPPGIKVMHDPEVTVLMVSAPVKEEVAPAAGAVEGEVAGQEPEVIKKEKKEEEAEEAPKEQAGKKEPEPKA